MRTLTQGKTSYPDMSQRQNPEFKQTATKYLNQKKQRKQLDHRKHIVSNQVKHFQKINDQLAKSLQQKQHELQWLKSVRERQQQEKQKLQELRLYNTTIRQKSRENIHDALTQLHRKKEKAHDEVQKTMKQLKDNFNKKKSLTDAANHVKRSRVKCKNRVNKFFQKKSTELTRYYNSMAQHEQEAFVTGVREIQQMHERESKFKRRINKKQAKMSRILNEIEDIKRSSFEIAASQLKSDRYGDGDWNSSSTVKNKSKISSTNRTQNVSEDRHSLGFKLTNVGSTQYIDQQEEIK